MIRATSWGAAIATKRSCPPLSRITSVPTSKREPRPGSSTFTNSISRYVTNFRRRPKRPDRRSIPSRVMRSRLLASSDTQAPSPTTSATIHAHSRPGQSSLRRAMDQRLKIATVSARPRHGKYSIIASNRIDSEPPTGTTRAAPDLRTTYGRTIDSIGSGAIALPRASNSVSATCDSPAGRVTKPGKRIRRAAVAGGLGSLRT